MQQVYDLARGTYCKSLSRIFHINVNGSVIPEHVACCSTKQTNWTILSNNQIVGFVHCISYNGGNNKGCKIEESQFVPLYNMWYKLRLYDWTVMKYNNDKIGHQVPSISCNTIQHTVKHRTLDISFPVSCEFLEGDIILIF